MKINSMLLWCLIFMFFIQPVIASDYYTLHPAEPYHSTTLQEYAPVQTTAAIFPDGIQWRMKKIPSIQTYKVAFSGKPGHAASHEGMDLVHNQSSIKQVMVVAADDGTVAYVRTGCPQSSMFKHNTSLREGGAGWGNHVVLYHGDGVYTRYAHLCPGSVKLRVGDLVKAGTVIGEMGNSGRSETRHLHFEVGFKDSYFVSSKPSQSFKYVLNPAVLFPKKTEEIVELEKCDETVEMVGDIHSDLSAQYTESIIARAMLDGDAEVRNAVSLLLSRGFLETKKNTDLESRENCFIVLKESALRRGITKDLMKKDAPDVHELEVDFINGCIELDGKLNSLMSSKPDFTVQLRIKLVSPNVIDFQIQKAEISGINMKRFSGIIFQLVKDRLSSLFKQDVDFSVPSEYKGCPVLRARFNLEAFAHSLGSNGRLTAIKISDSDLRLFIDLL